MLKPGQIAAVEIIASSDYDFNAAFRKAAQIQAGIGEGGGRGFEQQELLGLATQDGAGHDAVLDRVEDKR